MGYSKSREISVELDILLETFSIWYVSGSSGGSRPAPLAAFGPHLPAPGRECARRVPRDPGSPRVPGGASFIHACAQGPLDGPFRGTPLGRGALPGPRPQAGGPPLGLSAGAGLGRLAGLGPPAPRPRPLAVHGPGLAKGPSRQKPEAKFPPCPFFLKQGPCPANTGRSPVGGAGMPSPRGMGPSDKGLGRVGPGPRGLLRPCQGLGPVGPEAGASRPSGGTSRAPDQEGRDPQGPVLPFGPFRGRAGDPKRLRGPGLLLQPGDSVAALAGAPMVAIGGFLIVGDKRGLAPKE
jgi:hypothetical protein